MFFLGVESFICCYNQQMPFIKSKMEGRAPQTHYLSKLTNTHYSFKNEGYILYVTSPD